MFPRSTSVLLFGGELGDVRPQTFDWPTVTTTCQQLQSCLTWILFLVLVAHRIDPLLRVIKLRKESTSTPPLKTQLPRLLPERCVDLVVLAEPPPGEPIRADIVLIHGLHGSLVNTWKQGLWNSEGRLVNFERPPKPPLRPPKRQRHSRANLFAPPHVSKRAKFDSATATSMPATPMATMMMDPVDTGLSEPRDQPFDETRSTSYEFAHRRFTYECGEPDEVHFADDVEYSFPTFRLRIEDDGRGGAAAKKRKNGNKVEAEPTTTPIDDDGGKRKSAKPKKDANWSPCWPGDWLPLDCPGVRVIALNYTTDPYLWRPVWITKRNRSSLVDRAREMSDLLIAKGVGRDCPSILELHSRFVALYHSGQLKIDVFSFVETALTLMSVLYLRIVGIDSADPGIGEVCGVHLDHREICKPRSRNCILYTELVKMINRVS
ncbi:AGAP011045-PA-like protein [Anopheles sinensis]|uniref:AGAP011045-PA-like protein n=1 Tax=Anopheles sinensis TaxID=74873 RepID=A0A084VCH2_ANOSI|nr:AGAP011045-PA-like protein [Anopheles sinensis]